MDFKQAKPIWAEGMEREKNITCGIWTGFRGEEEKVLLRVTGSSLYRVFLNGKLVGYGPARAHHHHFRIDEWDLSQEGQTDQNILYIETAGYNINSYYTLDQPAFVQAELMVGDEIVAATGVSGFVGRVIRERVRKTPKYSFQRPFTEAWRLTPEYAAAYTSIPDAPDDFTVQPEVEYLARNVMYPEFTQVYPTKITASGKATDGHQREIYHRDRAVTDISPILKGFTMDELEINLNDLAQEFDYIPDQKPMVFTPSVHLDANRYVVYAYDRIDAGFPAFHVECETDMTLWFIWDEMVQPDGDLNYNRHIECINAMRLELKAGIYDFTGFEAYVYMGMKFIALGGACTISNVHLIEYAAPIPAAKPCPVNDADAKLIYDAAVNSYRLCCLESYMDDPSRERNDCLFDSYFMAHGEYLLTGSYAVEHNMMEAYCYAEQEDFSPLKVGQVPMMYPGDHYDGCYVPTHNMWLIIQFSEYVKRSGDCSMIEPFRKRFYQMYDYLHSHANEDGLLENLKGWIFIDWEEANDAASVAAVSYIANMIYTGMLKALYDLYGEEKFVSEAEQIRASIRKQSLRNGVFHDTALRDQNGQLVLTDVITQACQSYAVYMGVADPEDRGVLNSLLEVPDGMSHQHSLTQGIRLAGVLRYFGRDVFLSELKRVYLYQAEQTGSLWEDDTPLRNLIEAIHTEVIALFEQLR